MRVTGRDVVGRDKAPGRIRRRDGRSRAGDARARRTAIVQITARAAAGALQGDNFGFVVLRRGSDIRRIPYAFSVSRLVADGRAGDPLKTTAVGRHACGDGSGACLPLADVAVLDPRRSSASTRR